MSAEKGNPQTEQQAKPVLSSAMTPQEGIKKFERLQEPKVGFSKQSPKKYPTNVFTSSQKMLVALS